MDKICIWITHEFMSFSSALVVVDTDLKRKANFPVTSLFLEF
jgi:hypothetical protein